jgi:hypothetical protein
MNDMQLSISFASLFIAIILRTLVPSLQKLQAGAKWDHTYTATAGLAIITSFASAAATFQTFTIPTGTTSILGIILISFLYGWGINDVLNTALADMPSASQTSPPPTSQTNQTQTPAPPSQPVTTTPPTTSSPGPPSVVTATTNQTVGTYQNWIVKIANGFLQVYPPAGIGMIGVGSVIGYSLSTDFLTMAKPTIDQAIAAAAQSTSTQVAPALQEQLASTAKT